jgi:hypothetical protein
MSNLPANITSLVAGINKAIATAHIQNVEGKHYLKMVKGVWVYGKDGIEVEEGSHWAVNINSLARGFIAWPADGSGGRPLGEEMRSIYQDPITEGELPNLANGSWASQVGFEVVCLNGEDKGTECIFKASTKGAESAFNDLLTSIGKYFNGSFDPDKTVPVISFETESYEHPKKSYGTIIKPVFKIVRWESASASLDTVEEVEDEPEVEVKEEAPRRRRRTA